MAGTRENWLKRVRAKHYIYALRDPRDEAENKARQVDYLLMRLKQRLAILPAGMGIVEYVQFDGKQEAPPPPAKTMLAQLRDRYLETHKASLEANTLATAEMHFRHLIGKFGEKFPIGEMTTSDLQDCIDHRAKATWHDKPIGAETIRKEIKTLRTAWNWATTIK